MKERKIKEFVRKRYGIIAREKSSCCGHVDTCETIDLHESISRKIGYTDEELNAVSEGATLGLGCGNPVALASLIEGETVLDLGSGAGLDCFLAAKKVGKNAKVIGVDMTPEMIEKARENAREGNYGNIEFRIGEIENLPVADNSVDVVISNCVINLSPDKKRVFQEAFRVLKPGGRLMISDIVLLKELPYFIRNSIEAYTGCISGAIIKAEYIDIIKAAGFQNIRVIDEISFPIECMDNDPTVKAIIEDLKITPEESKEAASSVVSIKVYGVKSDRERS
ncbi:MAG: arsenite methyltransferase [Thermodesulfovibrionia bacterium]|nr:arsenite methyltransferase [Thermodesulfovibrionia bacterium]